ncbi:MarR family transcriptional regulator [Rugamonas sp. FT107W]|uniref:MarR family transcriptional regulator n=1 Tax=Duganella vulcania TaxID=2692166 RepID=A0A845H9X4_9BURK|nr:MarR family transcriptional regulator [Duganella vulcania]MYN15872.1 MarR family transcriptional regulator [Duganella vulcania]
MIKETPVPKDAIALADDLRAALLHVFRRIRHEGDHDPSGLSLQHRLLLSTIDQNPGIGVAELARQEKLRGPTMSAHIKTLENAGLVRRDTPNPEDRRRVGLLLTKQGEALMADLRSRRRDWLARRLAQLQPEGAQALRTAIQYLNEIGE